MPSWKRNLFACWIGVFIAAIGMSEVAPILPLYLHHLGIENASLISKLSGITFGSTYFVSAIFAPIWGHAADRIGRKPIILRAGLGLSVIYLLMGFAPNVTVLLILSMVLVCVQGAVLLTLFFPVEQALRHNFDEWGNRIEPEEGKGGEQ